LTRSVHLILVLATGLLLGAVGDAYPQGIKMTVGQTGTNPGTALYFIAEKENLFAKHGLNVNIVKTNTAAAVQAMLGGSMQMSTGSGAAAFVTATLEGAPPFVLVGSWVNVFPYKVMTQKDITKVEDLKGKTGHVGAPFGTIPDTALRFALTRLKLDPDKDVKLVQIANAKTSIIAQWKKGMSVRPLAPRAVSPRRRISLSDFTASGGIPAAERRMAPTVLSTGQSRQCSLHAGNGRCDESLLNRKKRCSLFGRSRDNQDDVDCHQLFAKWADRGTKPKSKLFERPWMPSKNTLTGAADPRHSWVQHRRATDQRRLLQVGAGLTLWCGNVSIPQALMLQGEILREAV
jgi:hypothetical protein